MKFSIFFTLFECRSERDSLNLHSHEALDICLDYVERLIKLLIEPQKNRLEKKLEKINIYEDDEGEASDEDERAKNMVKTNWNLSVKFREWKVYSINIVAYFRI